MTNRTLVPSSFLFFAPGIEGFMEMRRRDRIVEAGAAAERPVIRQGSTVCVHDEEEQEPQPVHGKPIISVNGEDVEKKAA